MWFIRSIEHEKSHFQRESKDKDRRKIGRTVVEAESALPARLRIAREPRSTMIAEQQLARPKTFAGATDPDSNESGNKKNIQK